MAENRQFMNFFTQFGILDKKTLQLEFHILEIQGFRNWYLA